MLPAPPVVSLSLSLSLWSCLSTSASSLPQTRPFASPPFSVQLPGHNLVAAQSNHSNVASHFRALEQLINRGLGSSCLPLLLLVLVHSLALALPLCLFGRRLAFLRTPDVVFCSGSV